MNASGEGGITQLRTRGGRWHDRIEAAAFSPPSLDQGGRGVAYRQTVTIAATMKLTTQRAADLLGVSRPTVVRLITDVRCPTERIGSASSTAAR